MASTQVRKSDMAESVLHGGSLPIHPPENYVSPEVRSEIDLGALGKIIYDYEGYPGETEFSAQEKSDKQAGALETAYHLKTIPFYFTPLAPYAAAADVAEAGATQIMSRINPEKYEKPHDLETAADLGLATWGMREFPHPVTRGLGLVSAVPAVETFLSNLIRKAFAGE